MNYSAHNQGILRSLILFFPNTTQDEIKFPTNDQPKRHLILGQLGARWRQIIRAASVEEIRLISSYLTAALLHCFVRTLFTGPLAVSSPRLPTSRHRELGFETRNFSIKATL